MFLHLRIKTPAACIANKLVLAHLFAKEGKETFQFPALFCKEGGTAVPGVFTYYITLSIFLQ